MSEPGGCAIASCSSCPCGKAAGVRYGGRCPLVDRKRGRDELLALEGDAAQTVWFIKRGTVVLSRSAADGVDRPRAVRGPGSFVGLEALIRTGVPLGPNQASRPPEAMPHTTDGSLVRALSL